MVCSQTTVIQQKGFKVCSEPRNPTTTDLLLNARAEDLLAVLVIELDHNWELLGLDQSLDAVLGDLSLQGDGGTVLTYKKARTRAEGSVLICGGFRSITGETLMRQGSTDHMYHRV